MTRESSAKIHRIIPRLDQSTWFPISATRSLWALLSSVALRTNRARVARFADWARRQVVDGLFKACFDRRPHEQLAAPHAAYLAVDVARIILPTMAALMMSNAP